MFDIRKILSRSWHILWNYRVLWIFGFLLAIGTGNADLGNQSRWSFNDGQRNPPSEQDWTPEAWQGEEWEDIEGDTFDETFRNVLRQIGLGFEMLREDHPEEFRLGIGVAITAFFVVLIFGTLVAVLRYTAENATIRMVNDYEDTGVKLGFREGWRLGWNRQALRLFLVNFVVNLPVLALFVILGLVAWMIFSALMGGAQATIISSLIAGGGIAFLAILVTVVVMAVLYIVRDFAWRYVSLEDQHTMESLRSGWALLRKEWRNIGLMWLIMIGINIAWGLAFIILVIPLLVASIITAVGGLAVALVPSLLTAGIAGLLSAPGYWPWIFAAVVGAPLFFLVTFSPVLLVSGWILIYNSSVWTLTYRELMAIDMVRANGNGGVVGSLETAVAPEDTETDSPTEA